MVRTAPDGSPLATLNLSLQDGTSVEAVLTLSDPWKEVLQGRSKLSDAALERFEDWYLDLSAMYTFDPDDENILSRWARDREAQRRAMAGLVQKIALPEPLGQRLRQVAGEAREPLAVAVRIEDQRLDRLPFELLDGRRTADRPNLVVWRCRDRAAMHGVPLRFLAVRSAPLDVRLANHEEELADIVSIVRERDGPPVDTEFERNANHADFVLQSKGLEPGTVHLATHGTRSGLGFKISKTHANHEYRELAPYLGTLPSVRVVISTACWSAWTGRVIGAGRQLCFARELVDEGIAAAIGMSGAFTPRASSVFTNSLYTELAKARPIGHAFARAVLSIRCMKYYDRNLWSVPVLYGDSNVIPFPDRDYLHLQEKLGAMRAEMTGLRSKLRRLETATSGRLGVSEGAMTLKMHKMRSILTEVSRTTVPGRMSAANWRQELTVQLSEIEFQMDQLSAALAQARHTSRRHGADGGTRLSQIASLLTRSLQRAQRLAEDQYPIAGNDA